MFGLHEPDLATQPFRFAFQCFADEQSSAGPNVICSTVCTVDLVMTEIELPSSVFRKQTLKNADSGMQLCTRCKCLV